MPSTYTTSNGLEKMGIGEDDSTWGDRLNNTIDLIDKSLDGWSYIDITAGSVAFSIANGVDSLARSRVVVFTGSPSGTVTMTLSSQVTKFYWMINVSSQSVNFTMGTNTLTLAPGAVAPIACDPSINKVYNLSQNIDGSHNLGPLSVASSVTINSALQVNGTIGSTGNITTGSAADIVSGKNMVCHGIYPSLEIVAPTGTFTHVVASSDSSLAAATASSLAVNGNTLLHGNLNIDHDVASAGDMFAGNMHATVFYGAASVQAPTGSFQHLLISSDSSLGSAFANALGIGTTLNVGSTIQSAGNITSTGGSLVSAHDVVGSGNGSFGNVIVNGTPIVNLIQSLIPAQGDPTNIAGNLVLSNISNASTSNGNWAIFTFGTTAGSRVKLAYGSGNANDGVTIAVPSGFNTGSMIACASLGQIFFDNAHQVNTVNVGVGGGGVVVAQGFDWGGTALGVTARWTALCWITGV